jgi:hypothetical protein
VKKRKGELNLINKKRVATGKEIVSTVSNVLMFVPPIFEMVPN